MKKLLGLKNDKSSVKKSLTKSFYRSTVTVFSVLELVLKQFKSFLVN